MQREPSRHRNKRGAWLGKVCLELGPYGLSQYSVHGRTANVFVLLLYLPFRQVLTLDPMLGCSFPTFQPPPPPPGLKAYTTLVLAPLAFLS